MTAPMTQADPVLDRAKQLRAAGASIDEVKQYLAAKGYHADDGPSVPSVRPDASSALPRNRPDAEGDYEVLGRGLAANALNAAQGIPGMEAVEAGAGYAGSRLPGNKPLTYQQSLAALRSQTSSIPAALSIPEKVLGGGGTVMRSLPKVTSIGGAAATGAGLGAADQALNADPNQSLGERAARTGIGAVAGGAIGGTLAGAPVAFNKGRELVGLAKRIKAAPTAGAEAVAGKNATADMDAQNYGLAEAQGAARQTSPALLAALEHPRVKPFADMIRSSEDFGGADDATVARETYKLMSEERASYQEAIATPGATAGKRAQARMEDRNLASAQKRLKDATAEISFKAPLHLDVADETTTVEPQITPERNAMSGPVSGKPLAATTTPPPNPTLRQALRDFPDAAHPTAMQGPGGPAFQLRADPGHVTPGVEIQTPKMQIETAPPERVSPVMPAFPRAVAEHAGNAEDAKQFQTGYTEGRQIMDGRALKAKHLAEKSPEAIAQRISTMKPDEAENYLRGALSGAKPQPGLPLPARHETLFGSVANLAAPAQRLNRLSPFVRSLDVQAGRTPPQPLDVQGVLRAMGLLNAPEANP